LKQIALGEPGKISRRNPSLQPASHDTFNQFGLPVQEDPTDLLNFLFLERWILCKGGEDFLW
jgi:hypothetical protein